MKLNRIGFRTIALIITAVMLLSTCATTISAASAASAAEEVISLAAEEKTTINYVSIGDSMANGYGFVGYEQDSKDINKYDFLLGKGMYGDGSYALQFAEYLSAGGTVDVNHTKLATSALLPNDLLYLLGAQDEEFNDYWGGYRDYVGYYRDQDEAVKSHFQNAVRDADVITLGIGNASFGAFLLDRVTNAIGILGAPAASYPNLTLENGLALLKSEEAKELFWIYTRVLNRALLQLSVKGLSAWISRLSLTLSHIPLPASL